MAEDFEVHPIAIEKTLTELREGLMQEYAARRVPRHRRSERRSRNLCTIQRWIAGIDSLLAQINEVNREVIPAIETDLGITIHDPDLITRVLADSSIQPLFRDILAKLPEEDLPVPANDLYTLYTMPDNADALALIGDVTMRLKVLPECDEKSTHPMEPVTAANVAALCDRWRLAEHVIGFHCGPPPGDETGQQKKWILASAVLGVLYREGGADTLRRAAGLLRQCGESRH
ncbi:hypothetical protein FGU65_13765 [Methanoculleus sp. FWC-SCC1]|uniref:Uncharacterized protein n=1 Tax=Methanoculleus frigidifontis TaxID=2584085 RepID=A0ABT8MDC6_9EURY|nr:hypothetical protein [Methanoculleus sp. FWC-SCC1]MDN7025937.1 hypothetical protein [Methanoculleus sp. FWC-SCC1]